MRKVLSLLVLMILVPTLVTAQPVPRQARGADNLAYKWGKVALLCTSRDTERFRPRPTVTSRFLGLIWTAVFDAWSRYDDKASPLYAKSIVRRPFVEHTIKNKETAISYAAYRAMMEYYVSDSEMLKQAMR